jgi:hypothetical protein
MDIKPVTEQLQRLQHWAAGAFPRCVPTGARGGALRRAWVATGAASTPGDSNRAPLSSAPTSQTNHKTPPTPRRSGLAGPEQQAAAPRRVALSSRPADREAPAVALRRRAAPFAALIPGDSVVEQVMATGLYNFM